MYLSTVHTVYTAYTAYTIHTAFIASITQTTYNAETCLNSFGTKRLLCINIILLDSASSKEWEWVSGVDTPETVMTIRALAVLKCIHPQDRRASS